MKENTEEWEPMMCPFNKNPCGEVCPIFDKELKCCGFKSIVTYLKGIEHEILNK